VICGGFRRDGYKKIEKNSHFVVYTGFAAFPYYNRYSGVIERMQHTLHLLFFGACGLAPDSASMGKMPENHAVTPFFSGRN